VDGGDSAAFSSIFLASVFSLLPNLCPRPPHRHYRNPLAELMGDPNPEKSKRVTDAILKMQKIFVADLQMAYDS
jgi:hypothetical protein